MTLEHAKSSFEHFEVALGFGFWVLVLSSGICDTVLLNKVSSRFYSGPESL